MAEKAAAAKGWTDTEKFGLLIQIIEKAGSIPWDDITLQEGRTKKACTVMIDREKQKLKKAREEGGGGGVAAQNGNLEGEDGDGGAKAGAKRKAASEPKEPKKPKTPRKKKGKSEHTAAEDDIAAAIKAEDDEDGLN